MRDADPAPRQDRDILGIEIKGMRGDRRAVEDAARLEMRGRGFPVRPLRGLDLLRRLGEMDMDR